MSSELRQRHVGPQATSAALVAKYGASFPNCELSKEKNCLEAGCGGESRVDGHIDNSPIKARFVLPCGTKVIASLPYLTHYGMRYMRSSALKFFYSDTLLVPLWWIAFTVVTAVAIDALTDPLAGTITDQFRSKWGRRRPFIAIGSIVTSVLFALLWMPCVFGMCPEDYGNMQCVDGSFGTVDGAWIYFFIVYILYFISLDLVFVALEAFSAELSPTYSDRNCLFGVQQVFSVIGIAIGVLTPGIISDPLIYFGAALAFGVVMVILCWVLVGCLKERGMAMQEEHEEAKSPKVSSELQAKKTLGSDGAAADPEKQEAGAKEETAASANSPGLSMEEMAAASMAEQEEVDAREAQKRKEKEELDALGIDADDLELVTLDELEDNSGLVPGFISSLRNSCFRVLLLSEICEALGDELQYTVLAFIPPYVIQPATLDSGTVYLLLAGTVLVFQLSTIPFWMFLGQRFGKYKGYLAYNFTLAVTVMLKILVGPEDELGLGVAVLAAVLWGIGLGGAFHLYRSMLADVIDYDELISGQRREGQFSIFGDFIPKMVEVPSTIVPLLAMAAYGYQPGVVQNQEVVWTLRLCFSIVPGFFVLLGALALLLYPKPAREGSKCLDAIHNGIVLHAAGKEAYDPIAKRMLAAPQVIRASVGGAAGINDMEHFFQYEIRQAVEKKSKGVLVCHTSIQVVLYVLLAIGMIVACAFDWQTNVTPNLDAGFAACNTYVSRTNCAGFNNSCTQCADGFYGPDCDPCPGLVDRSDDATNDFVGVACNGQGVCDPVNGTCTCTEGSGYYGPWCGVYEDDPTALFPIYIAILGIAIFFVGFHGVRLSKALALQKNEAFTMTMMAEYNRLAFGRDLTDEEKAEVEAQEKAAEERRARLKKMKKEGKWEDEANANDVEGEGRKSEVELTTLPQEE